MPEPDEATERSPLSGRFLVNVNFVFLSAWTSNTVGFVVVILLARALGPDGRGVTALYQTAVSLGVVFLSLGVGAAALYYVARAEMTARQGMEVGLSVTLFATLLTAIGVLVTAAFFDTRFEAAHVPYWLAIPTVPTLIQLRVVSGVLRAEGRFGAMNALELGGPLSMLVILGGLELVSGLTVSNTIWGWSGAYLVILALGYALLGRGVWPRGIAPVSLVVRTLRFGLQSEFGNLIHMLNYRFDTILVSIFVNTTGVGLYSVASSQTEGLWIIASSVAVVLMTNITAGDAANAARMTPVVCRNTLLVTAVVALGALILAPFWLTAVFGEAYEGSVLPYVLLLPGTVALSGSQILAAYVFSRGKPMINAWIALATLIATLPIQLVLTRLLGVPGAALATTATYSISLALQAIAYRRLSGGSILEALIPQPGDLALYVDAGRSLLRRIRGRPTVDLTSDA